MLLRCDTVVVVFQKGVGLNSMQRRVRNTPGTVDHVGMHGPGATFPQHGQHPIFRCLVNHPHPQDEPALRHLVADGSGMVPRDGVI